MARPVSVHLDDSELFPSTKGTGPHPLLFNMVIIVELCIEFN